MVVPSVPARGPRHRYLQSRLGLIVLAVALPLLVLLALSIRDARSKAEERSYAMLKQRADQVAARATDMLEKAEHLLNFMASRQRLRLLDVDACTTLMAGVAGGHSAYTNIGLFDAAGRAVCTSTANRSRTHFADLVWFREGLKADGPWLSDPLRGPISGRWVIYMTTPVYGEAGLKMGLLAVSLDLQPLVDAMAPLNTEPGHSVVLRKDRRLYVVRHPEPERWVGQPLPPSLLAPARLSGAPVQVAVGVDGLPRAFAITALPKFGLEAAAGMPAAQVYAEANAEAWRGLGAAALAIGLGLAAALFAARRVTRALNSVADTARQLQAGATDVRADEGLPGEFGEVATEFNRLMDRNQERATQLLQSQRRAERLRRFYETLSAIGQAIARQASPQALYEEVCRACRSTGLARQAWISLRQPGGPAAVGDAAAESDLAPWGGRPAAATARALAERRAVTEQASGCLPVAAVPFLVDDEVVGVLTLLGPDDDAFDDDMATLLAELGRELSFGLELDRHKQARAALAAAEAANRAKTTFLSHVSHELRTPLNAVLGFAQLGRAAHAEGRHEPVDGYLAHVLSAGGQLRSLIDDLMDVSRIESGEMSIEMADVDVVAKMAHIAQLNGPLAAERDVSFHMDFAPGGRLPMRSDPLRLRQVLMNLVSNAIKYNRPGGHVTLEARREGNTVRLQVRDNGHGMSDSQLDTLFQAFNRMGREKTSIEGTGIGLFITKRLVELLGGSLQVQSREGVGTTVTVTLPYVAPTAARAVAPRAEPVDPDALVGRVLYIEDNPVNATLVEHFFQRHPQVQLSLAETGQQGLALARSLQPDLVLLDMQLPDMTGLQVIARLRADRSTAALRVVALSANAMPQDVDAALRAGVEAYWAKPIDFAQLHEGVARVLAEQRALVRGELDLPLPVDREAR
ncbi:ATP-binding protein [Aquincola tertiaricarbonis]|uniref:histidine kinase n=1 Tax=Aquincola tertiaricarbonis TaxID=391953 RepID=A0ABY4S259_AQUTE|nr:ATP-binding protein [Aquincola tertiaricarbonis]URI06459.1 ATP-binding protein [Aquincola tertiaricarbonis]